MLGSIYIGLSGMQAYSQGMKTISNNVANLDTLGYKASTLSFSDVFSDPNGSLGYTDSQSGGSNGAGVRYNKETIDFTPGTLQQTGGALDLAIDGNGFLVVQDEHGDTFYAKTGQFSVDSKGYVVDQAGSRLMTLGASNQPEVVNVTNQKTFAPVATKTITFAQNLSSSATTGDVPNIRVYDSNGVAHTWDVSLAKDTTGTSTGTSVNWTATIKDETGATLGTGTVTFTGGVAAAGSSITINATPTGADAMSVALDFSSATSFSAGTTNTLQASKVDGNAVGTLSSVTVNSQGQVVLNYSNSQTTIVGSVALATFQDQQQLVRVGNGLFRNAPKNAVHYATSGTEGTGSLQTGQVEASNVNLTAEFGNLILIQRGFDASSQVVSATNDMIQQLFGMRGHG
ncbi:flagellar basal-body rod protein FlgF [Asticcacaulis solisilvae]|uniref:flagellar basal-body rod protein FlgF n=1 Tax=Asticcacaulis solisilvae TaxID=1217274 RepID=UPI003FD8CBA3